MAVSSDVGHPTDVHPTNKRPIGERLARLALFYLYGYERKGLIAGSPLFESVSFYKGKATISFKNSVGLRTSDAEAPKSFEVAEADGIFCPAQAKILKNKVEVISDKVKNPVYVRYGFKPINDGNLVNKDGLPASTFSSK